MESAVCATGSKDGLIVRGPLDLGRGVREECEGGMARVMDGGMEGWSDGEREGWKEEGRREWGGEREK